MKMFLLGFLACYVIASALIFADTDTTDRWLDKFIVPFCAAGIVILIIPSLVWRFVRLCFVPVRPDVMEYLKDAHVKRLLGDVYFCYDKTAKSWINKFFLFRFKSSK